MSKFNIVNADDEAMILEHINKDNSFRLSHGLKNATYSNGKKYRFKVYQKPHLKVSLTYKQLNKKDIKLQNVTVYSNINGILRMFSIKINNYMSIYNFKNEFETIEHMVFHHDRNR